MVIIFWAFVVGVLVFLVLAKYGQWLATQDPKTTPYGRAVAARYERDIDKVVDARVSAAMSSMADRFYIVPK